MPEASRRTPRWAARIPARESRWPPARRATPLPPPPGSARVTREVSAERREERAGQPAPAPRAPPAYTRDPADNRPLLCRRSASRLATTSGLPSPQPFLPRTSRRKPPIGLERAPPTAPTGHRL